MSDDMISQEEIDALLNGGGLPSGDAPAADAPAADAPSVEPPPAEAAPEGGGAAPVVDDPFLCPASAGAFGEVPLSSFSGDEGAAACFGPHFRAFLRIR